MSKQPSISYKDAGVDIDAGEALVERIKGVAKRTARPEVMGGLGGFGGGGGGGGALQPPEQNPSAYMIGGGRGNSGGGNGAGLAVGALLIEDITGSAGWSGLAVVAMTLGAAIDRKSVV